MESDWKHQTDGVNYELSAAILSQVFHVFSTIKYNYDQVITAVDEKKRILDG